AKPPPKEPLQDLLQAAHGAGLAVVLGSQNPAGLDYRPCGLIHTWFVGRMADQRSVDKMKPLFAHRPLGYRNLTTLEPGRCVMLHDDGSLELERGSSLLRPEPIGDAELMALAARTVPRSQDGAAPRGRGNQDQE